MHYPGEDETLITSPGTTGLLQVLDEDDSNNRIASATQGSVARRLLPPKTPDYSIAQYTLRYHRKDGPEIMELVSFDGESLVKMLVLYSFSEILRIFLWTLLNIPSY